MAAVESSTIYNRNDEETTEHDSRKNSDFEVHALEVKTDRPVKCWKCGDEGHMWDMCVKERQIFCYGCGLRNVYKPQCLKCWKNSKKYSGIYHNRIDPKLN